MTGPSPEGSRRRGSRAFSLVGEGVAYPAQRLAFDGDHIEAARRQPSLEMAPGQGRQPLAGGQDQTALLVPVYTGKRPAETMRIALAHLQEDQMLFVPQQQVDLAAAGAQLARQDARAMPLHVVGGALFRPVAALLAGGTALRRGRRSGASAPQAAQRAFLGPAGLFERIHGHSMTTMIGRGLA